MASRVYRTTRLLNVQVEQGLQHLGVSTLGTPTLAALIALSVTGLLVLDARPTQTRVPRCLPGRCHDALNRLRCTTRLARRGRIWPGTRDPQTHVIWRGTTQAVRDLAPQWRLKWRQQVGVRARTLRVVAPTYGTLRVVVVSNRHGNWEYLVSNALSTDLTTMVQRKRRRWSGETIFRDTKHYAGLEACHWWVDQAMVRHVALVLMTFVVLQLLRTWPDESVAAVKERWQLAVLRDGEKPPKPLRACPPALRPTA